MHGIFDFIHRDPKTLEPYFSASRVEGPKHAVHLGNWVIPLGGGTAEQLRKGTAFWEILDRHGIPNVVFRIPSNFPPVPAKGQTLSGMGTPDLRGTYGTFSFYTDDPMQTPGAVEGGQIISVRVDNSKVVSNLIGPDNPFRKGSPPATEPFSVSVDPMGLNGLYLNLKGREREGIVNPGAEAEVLKEELRQKLNGLADPASGRTGITGVFDCDAVYAGPYVDNAPDLIVGYGAGYRASWPALAQ